MPSRQSRWARLEFTACIWGPTLDFLLWGEYLSAWGIAGIVAIVIGSVLCLRVKETTP